MEGKHYVLVHGACHGAWCWYKVKPLLQRAGHRVTVLDLAGSGVHLKTMDEVQTLSGYSEPLIQLMSSIPDDQKVVIVGHSLGGLNLALVMELFPHKIEVAVFLAALMPDAVHHPSFVLDQLLARKNEGGWLDTEFKCSGDPSKSIATLLFGPKYLSLLYHRSPVEDYEPGIALRRPSSLFLHDLRKAKKFSKEGYGSVRRVYVIHQAAKTLLVWLCSNAP